jgi:hypothetical protein
MDPAIIMAWSKVLLAIDVLLNAWHVRLPSEPSGVGRGRASNQFEEKSKKHWSAQLHEEAKRIKSRKEQ